MRKFLFSSLFAILFAVSSYFVQARSVLVDAWPLFVGGELVMVQVYYVYEDDCHPPMICDLVDIDVYETPYVWYWFGGIESKNVSLDVENKFGHKSLSYIKIFNGVASVIVSEDATISIYSIETGKVVMNEVCLRKNSAMVLNGIENNRRYICMSKSTDGTVQWKTFFINEGQLFEGIQDSE